MPLQSSMSNAIQMSCQHGINSVYACPRLFFSALRYSSDTLSKFPFCHTHKSLSWPSLVWLGWLWSLISVWHTVSLRTQSFPEALAKLWQLVGSWNFWLSYTVRKVISIALQRCMSLGSLCQKRVKMRIFSKKEPKTSFFEWHNNFLRSDTQKSKNCLFFVLFLTLWDHFHFHQTLGLLWSC